MFVFGNVIKPQGLEPLQFRDLRLSPCQYHVVFIPKYRKKVIYGELRRDLGEDADWPSSARARWKKGI